MKRADKLYREMVLSGRSMGRRRRLPRRVVLGAVLTFLGCVFCRALDSEAALWHVGDYGAPEEVESWR